MKSMLNLTELTSLCQKAKPIEKGDFDLHFEEIVSLCEKENYQEAVPLIEKVLQEGCLDIRLIMYLSFAEFIKKGPTSFTTLFPQFIFLLDQNWDKISPLKMKEKHIFNSATWFFSTVVKKIKRSEQLFKEERPDFLWKISESTITEEHLIILRESFQPLIQFFKEKWEQPSINQYILRILKWVENFPYKKSFSLISEEEALIKPKDFTLEEPSPALTIQRVSLEELLCSPLMKQFYEKLKAFEKLVENEDFSKAALISDDIRTILENFNATAFFPKLFSNYFALLAKHIDLFSEEWEQKESLKWAYLNQLYQIDLDAFLTW